MPEATYCALASLPVRRVPRLPELGALGWAQLQTPRQGTQQGTEPHAWLARCLPAGHKEAVSLVTKGGSLLRLEVDLQSNHTLGPVPAASAITLVPLHLGGLPGEWGLGLGGGGST